MVEALASILSRPRRRLEAGHLSQRSRVDKTSAPAVLRTHGSLGRYVLYSCFVFRIEVAGS